MIEIYKHKLTTSPRDRKIYIKAFNLLYKKEGEIANC